MKRTVALTILGLATAAVTTAYGAGVFQFSNYASPYVPIAYDLDVPNVGGSNVAPGEGVTIELWWGLGADADEASLVFGDVANFSAFAGYTDRTQVFEIAEFVSGQTWTVQYRASGNVDSLPVDMIASRGPLVNVSAIGDTTPVPPELPGFTRSPGFAVSVVPEPTTFALAGLGAAALLIFRRRD
jgi:hypothetical protein